MAETRGVALSDLTVADLKTIHPLFSEDVTAVRRPGWWWAQAFRGQSCQDDAAVQRSRGDRSTCGAQVWDFNRSAEMRDTEGGVSKRSVLEQVAKMRKYLAAEGVAAN